MIHTWEDYNIVYDTHIGRTDLSRSELVYDTRTLGGLIYLGVS